MLECNSSLRANFCESMCSVWHISTKWCGWIISTMCSIWNIPTICRAPPPVLPAAPTSAAIRVAHCPGTSALKIQKNLRKSMKSYRNLCTASKTQPCGASEVWSYIRHLGLQGKVRQGKSRQGGWVCGCATRCIFLVRSLRIEWYSLHRNSWNVGFGWKSCHCQSDPKEPSEWSQSAFRVIPMWPQRVPKSSWF